MKIGLIRMRYTPYGGAEVFLSRLIDDLINRGHECHVFANRWTDEGRDGLVFHKVRMIRCPSFLKVLSFALFSYLSIRKNHFDIVVSLERTFLQDIYRAGDGCHREWLYQRKKITSPIRYALMRVNPLHLAILFIEKRLFTSKRLKMIITNSRMVKDEIIRHYGLPHERIHVIYNGINIDDFNIEKKEDIRKEYRKRLGIALDDILLIFVGSGFERKGLRFVMEAMALINGSGNRGHGSGIHESNQKKRNLRLLVVGKGNSKNYLKLADRLGIGEVVTFKGPVKDVKGYYYASDIFVLPTIYEPFSNACIEAMVSGLPVITSRANGVSEILSHGKDGYVVEDPTNPNEIADMINRLFDLEKRERIGEMARLTARSYSIKKNVDEIMSLVNL